MTREEIRETIRASRREQGLPENVVDARLLFELASEVAEGGGDHGEAS